MHSGSIPDASTQQLPLPCVEGATEPPQKWGGSSIMDDLSSTSGWDYRVIHRVHGDERWFSVHEVYYNDDDKPILMTKDEVSPHGDTFEEFEDSFKAYNSALDKPVIEEEYFASLECENKDDTKV